MLRCRRQPAAAGPEGAPRARRGALLFQAAFRVMLGWAVRGGVSASVLGALVPATTGPGLLNRPQAAAATSAQTGR